MIAKKYSDLADKKKDDTNFLKNNYDACQSMGKFHHAFILSFYFLLRYKPQNQENFY
jgi:hypothetical protein